MFEGIIRYFTLNPMDDKEVGSNGKINIVPGFETYLGNFRVIQRMLKEMGVAYTLLCDPTEVLDTPADGKFRMYAGGTTQDEVKDAPNAIDHLAAAALAAGKDQEVRRDHLEARRAQAQHPDGPGVDRRVPDEGLRSHRQADPRRRWPRSAAVWWT